MKKFTTEERREHEARQLKSTFEKRNDLFRQFYPVVRGRILPIIEQINKDRRFSIFYKNEDKVGIEMDLEHQETHSGLGVEVWHFIVRLTGGQVYFEELQRVMKELDAFCTWEIAPFQYGDLGYTIGDGDDSNAVAFKDGMFIVWLRGFPEGQI